MSEDIQTNDIKEESYKQWKKITKENPYGRFLLFYITFINYNKQSLETKKDLETIQKLLKRRDSNQCYQALENKVSNFGNIGAKLGDVHVNNLLVAYKTIINNMDLINISFKFKGEKENEKGEKENEKGEKENEKWEDNKSTLDDNGIYDFKERWKSHFQWMEERQRKQYKKNTDRIIEFLLYFLYFARCDLIHGTLETPEAENTQKLFFAFNTLLEILIENIT